MEMTLALKHRFFPIVILLLVGCSSSDKRPISPGSSDPSDTSTSENTDPDATDPDATDPDATDSEPKDTGPITSPECENEGEQFCNYQCMIPNTDKHCGACNVGCGAGQICVETGGKWDCDCSPDKVRCNNFCVDPLTSRDFCGASGACAGDEQGQNCGFDRECVNGNCQCLPGLTKCDNTCVNTLTNAQYCGASPVECGVQCMAGGVCETGVCGCPASAPTECAIGCVDTLTEDFSCGGCVESGGVECDTVNNFTCQEGTCQCAPGLTLCEGKCIDTKFDSLNCGGCYNNGEGPGIQCEFSDPPANSIRKGCYIDTCVDSPCDPLVMGTKCDGLTLRTKSDCLQSDDHFKIAAIKCDNNVSAIPINTPVCYEIRDVPLFKKFRCWWSGRSLTVNNTPMSCSKDGDIYLPLPAAIGGSYCVYFPPSTGDGAETDGFAMGNVQ